MRRLGVLIVAGMTLSGCGLLGSGNQGPETARAELVDTSGNRVGTATLTQQANGVLVDVQVTGMAPGRHGFHIHQVGACDAPSFESAGGHFNPMNGVHGLENPEGPHGGDLPNLVVRSNRTGSVSYLNPWVTLRGGNAILDGDGAAIVIHEGPDDYYTDPSGNSGARVACGAVRG